MPYDNVEQLPEYIKKKPPDIQRQWMHVFNSCWKSNSDVPEKNVKDYASEWQMVLSNQ